VRISDVAPDGSVTQVAGAGFNGTHRFSARNPQDIVPGEQLTLEVELHFTSWVFPKGHRIRLAVANAQWPMMWPTPYLMTTTLYLDGRNGTYVDLPIVPQGRYRSPAFLQPAASPALSGYESIDTGTSSGYGELSSVNRNPQTGEVTAVATNSGATRYPWGTETYRERIEHRTSDADPARTAMHGSHRLEVTMPGRKLLWEADMSFRSDADNFYYDYVRKLSENGELVREKNWTKTVPRDFQ
jgi:predicted acyl esterase